VVTILCSLQVRYRTEMTSLRKSFEYFLVYKTLCFLIFRGVGPMVALIILNTLLIDGLRNMRRRRNRRSGSGDTEMKRTVVRSRWNLTLMMVVVVSVFIVCSAPDLGLRIAVAITELMPDCGLDVGLMIYANTATNTLITSNTAANFVIYCLVCTKFRNILVRRLAMCWQWRGCMGGGGASFRKEALEPMSRCTEPSARCLRASIDTHTKACRLSEMTIFRADTEQLRGEVIELV